MILSLRFKGAFQIGLGKAFTIDEKYTPLVCLPFFFNKMTIEMKRENNII